MFEKNNTLNPWTNDDERHHIHSALEWWAVETFFQTKEDKKSWCLKLALSDWIAKDKKTGSLCNMTLFDQEANTHSVLFDWNDTTRLQAQKDTFEVHHGDSYIKGGFPTYQVRIHDVKNDIEIDITLQADSYPHWVGQRISDGWLPIGIGSYRYGFIPKNTVTGTLKKQGKTYTVEGSGYYEHVWGNFDYDQPLFHFEGLGKTIGSYVRLMLWWLSNHHRRIPRSISFSSENNPFGYDWAWALFDNGWSLFYGNAMFWVSDGPAAGILIFTKDGKTYTDFSDITFHYRKIAYAKDYDFYYPTELELIAKKEEETLHLNFTRTNASREYARTVHPDQFLIGLAICETPGKVTGYYDDGKQKIPLSGMSKLEPQRELTAVGHNSLSINFLCPPQGVGISFQLESHLLLRRIAASFQLAPRVNIQWKKTTIDASTIHKNKR